MREQSIESYRSACQHLSEEQHLALFKRIAGSSGGSYHIQTDARRIDVRGVQAPCICNQPCVISKPGLHLGIAALNPKTVPLKFVESCGAVSGSYAQM